MDIGILGVNFKSADLYFREKLAQNLQASHLTQNSEFSIVILSTCNRFEIYFSSENLTDAHSCLLQKVRSVFDKDCGFKLYSYFGKDCFAHLCRVTSGLDSAILIETEIQGQVKRAYLGAQQKLFAKELHFIFQKSLKIGKDMRSKITFEPKVPNLIYTIKNLLCSLRQEKEKPRILFVGTSDINTKVLSQIETSLFDVSICSKSNRRGEEKAKRFNVSMLPWEKLPSWPQYDGLILATHYSNYIIHKPIEKIKDKKMILDLSVPRNVHPNLKEVDHIELFNIDQLNKIVRRYRKLKDHDLAQLDLEIQYSVNKQFEIFKKRSQYTEKIESII